MRIIGIDPGTATTGFAIIETNKSTLQILNYGCIKTSSKLQENIRLKQIAEDLEFLIKKWKPEKASVEKLFFKKNIKTAISVAQARGVIIQKLTENNIEFYEYSPSEIKSSICGFGNADKKMVQQMLKIMLKLKQEPKPDDAADAIATAICLANSIKLINRIQNI